MTMSRPVQANDFASEILRIQPQGVYHASIVPPPAPVPAVADFTAVYPLITGVVVAALFALLSLYLSRWWKWSRPVIGSEVLSLAGVQRTAA